MHIFPNSHSLEEEHGNVLKERWSDAARAAAIAARRLQTRPSQPHVIAAHMVQGKGGISLGRNVKTDGVRDAVVFNFAKMLGNRVGNAVHHNIAIRVGVKTKPAYFFLFPVSMPLLNALL